MKPPPINSSFDVTDKEYWLLKVGDNTKLDCTGNEIGAEGAVKLAEALMNANCKLQQLDLRDNLIGDEGKKALAEAVASSECKLHMLHLDGETLRGGGSGNQSTDDQLSDAQLEIASTWEELPWRRARLMVVGEGRAGKTSLLRSLRGEPFMDTPSTQGLEMSGCLLERDDVIDSDWSLAGEGTTEYSRAVGAKLLLNPEPPPSAVPAQRSDPSGPSSVAETRQSTSTSVAAPSATSPLTEIAANEPSPDDDRATRTPRTGRMRRLDKGLVASCMQDGVHKQVVISVWDYAGQELFDALHQLFLSQQGVYLLVFSMSALQADAESVLQRLSFWLNSLRLHARNAPLLLVGTHGDKVQDLEGRHQLSRLLSSRLPSWPGKTKCSQGLCFFPVDNTLSGRDSRAGAPDQVAELRGQINARILNHQWEEKNVKFIDYPVPVPYFRLYDQLGGLQAELAARMWLQRLKERAEYVKCHGATEAAHFLEAMSVTRHLAEDAEVLPDMREELRAAVASYTGLETRLGPDSSDAAHGGVEVTRAARKAVATLEEVTQLARECGLSRGEDGAETLVEEVRKMLTLFHRLGVALYFDNIPALQGLVILDPQWLIDIVCAVARDFGLHSRRCDERLEHHHGLQEKWQCLKDTGVLDSDLLEILWSAEGGVDPAPAGPEERAGLLALLQHFGLVYKLEGAPQVAPGAHGKYLVPCLLPEKEEEEEQLPELGQGARFDINFVDGLPQAPFQQLVVRALQRGQAFGRRPLDQVEYVRRHSAELSFGDDVHIQMRCPLGARRIRVDVLASGDDTCAGDDACAAALREVEVLMDSLDMSIYHGKLFSRAASPDQTKPLLDSGAAEHILLQRRSAAPEDEPEVSLMALRRAMRKGVTMVCRYSDRRRKENVAHFEHWQLRHTLSPGGTDAASESSERSCETYSSRALPAGCQYHFFVAHKFTTGGDQVHVLCGELERVGWKPWYYNYLDEVTVTEEHMRAGVQRSHCVVLFLSREVFSSPSVLLELREAQRRGKRVLMVHEAQLEHAKVVPDDMRQETPADLRDLLWGGGLSSIPFQRHRRTGLTLLIQTLIRHAELEVPQSRAAMDEGIDAGFSGVAEVVGKYQGADNLEEISRPSLEPYINAPGHWDFFVSYSQRDGKAEALSTELHSSLEKRGYRCWLDVKMDDRGESAMEEGVRQSKVLIAIVTDGGSAPNDAYFKRPFCLQELRWAQEARRFIQPVVRVEDKQRIGELLSGAPEDLRYLGRADWIDVNRGSQEQLNAGITQIINRKDRPAAFPHPPSPAQRMPQEEERGTLRGGIGPTSPTSNPICPAELETSQGELAELEVPQGELAEREVPQGELQGTAVMALASAGFMAAAGLAAKYLQLSQRRGIQSVALQNITSTVGSLRMPAQSPIHSPDSLSADVAPKSLSQTVQERPPGGFIQLPRSELKRGIFISHSRRDPAALNAVCALMQALRFDLRADGRPVCQAVHSGAYELWKDNEQMEILGGDQWEERLREAQKKCALTVVFLSNAYCASKQCTLELDFSVNKNRKVMPVFLEQLAQTAEEFVTWQETTGTACDPERASFDNWEIVKDVVELKVQGKQGLPCKLLMKNFVCDRCRGTRDIRCNVCGDSKKAALRNSDDSSFLNTAEALGRMIDGALCVNYEHPTKSDLRSRM